MRTGAVVDARAGTRDIRDCVGNEPIDVSSYASQQANMPSKRYDIELSCHHYQRHRHHRAERQGGLPAGSVRPPGRPEATLGRQEATQTGRQKATQQREILQELAQQDNWALLLPQKEALCEVIPSIWARFARLDVHICETVLGR